MQPIDYKQIIHFGSEKQQEYARAVIDHGSVTKAAKALGVQKKTLQRGLQRLRAKAAKKGVAPELGVNCPSPTGFDVTTYRYSANQEYVPAFSKLKPEKLDIDELIDILNKDIKPLKPIKEPKKTEKDLLNLYTLSDIHFGMFAWGLESGEDWDLKISKEKVSEAFNKMISQSPNAEECYISLLGDTLHTDGYLPLTPASGHVLDADTRFDKIVETVIEFIIQIVDLAAKKHKKVKILIATGNHDPSTSAVLRHAFKAIYAKNTRIEVDTSPSPFYVHQFGKVMLGFHHGHNVKFEKLPMLFATDFSEIWGSTKYRYSHSGHHHTYQVQDTGGMTILKHPTISAQDAYAARNGFRSQRGCISHTYHRHHGEVSSIIIRPTMLD